MSNSEKRDTDEKWIEIYNSIILLFYFIKSYTSNYTKSRDSIEKLNKYINKFRLEYNINGGDFNIIGGANLLVFVYLVIVRIYEYMNKATNGYKEGKIDIFKDIMEYSKEMGYNSFDDIIEKFNVELTTFAYSDKNNHEKLYYFFEHIRHSISHFSYHVDVEQEKVKLISKDPKSSKPKLDMEIPMLRLLELTANFGMWINNTKEDTGRPSLVK